MTLQYCPLMARKEAASPLRAGWLVYVVAGAALVMALGTSVQAQENIPGTLSTPYKKYDERFYSRVIREYQAGYKYRDGFWKRLAYNLHAKYYFPQSRETKIMDQGFSSETRKHWQGDMPQTNRIGYEAYRAGLFSDFIGKPSTKDYAKEEATSTAISSYQGNITVDKRVVQREKAEDISSYQGNITRDKRVVQREKAEDISSYQGNITRDKRVVQREKAEDISEWTGNYINDKEEREKEAAERLSNWTGNYYTNKQELERKKAEEISEYEGTIYNDKKARQDRTARDSRNYDGTERVSWWYLFSGDSKSKYKRIPKGNRDKKEKGLWYD